MAKYLFRVNFRGLCGFLPVVDDQKALQRMNVLLVDASKRARDSHNSPRDVHHALLFFETKNLSTRGSVPEGAEGVVRLSGHDVLILPDKMHSPIIHLKPRTGTGEVPADDEDGEAFDWVPRLDELHPEAGEPHPDCLAINPGRGRLAARVRLTHGELRTGHVGVFGDTPILTQFEPQIEGRPQARQALAAEVVLDMEVEGVVHILINEFGKSEPRKLELGPHDRGIQISIMNVCARSFFRDHEPTAEMPQPDRDFEWLYRLTRRLGDEPHGRRRLPIPFPVSFVPLKGDGGVDPAECTETQLSPVKTEDAESLDNHLNAVAQL